MFIIDQILLINQICIVVFLVVFLSFTWSPFIPISIAAIIIVVESCHFSLCGSAKLLRPSLQHFLRCLHPIHWFLSLLNFSYWWPFFYLFAWIQSLFCLLFFFCINNSPLRSIQIASFLRLIESFHRFRLIGFIEIISSLWLFVMVYCLLLLATGNIRLRVTLSFIRYSDNDIFIFDFDNFSWYSSFWWVRIHVNISVTFIIFSFLLFWTFHELRFCIEHPKILFFFLFLK